MEACVISQPSDSKTDISSIRTDSTCGLLEDLAEVTFIGSLHKVRSAQDPRFRRRISQSELDSGKRETSSDDCLADFSDGDDPPITILHSESHTLVDEATRSDGSTDGDTESRFDDATRSLLAYYLGKAETEMNFRKYKWKMAQHARSCLRFTNQLMHLLFLIVTSRCFWNVVWVVSNVAFAVFFYMVLACSTIIVSLIVNIHEATTMNSGVVGRQVEKLKKSPDIDELST